MKSSENPQVLHFCVNYQCHEDILQLSEFWRHNTDVQSGLVQPIVVDNSPQKSGAALSNLPSCVTYMTPGDNLGYIGGPRWAFSQFKNQNWKWLIVSNADLEFSNDFYTCLSAIDQSDVGMIAPQVVGQVSGMDQNPYMIERPSRGRMRFWVFIKSIVPLAQLYHGASLLKDSLVRRWQKPKAASIKAGDPIYAPHGSVLIFNRNYFDRGGDLNHVAFIFAEEIYFAERMRELGLKVQYRPELKVVHREHAATGYWPRPLMIRYAHQAMRNVYNAYFAEC